MTTLWKLPKGFLGVRPCFDLGRFIKAAQRGLGDLARAETQVSMYWTMSLGYFEQVAGCSERYLPGGASTFEAFRFVFQFFVYLNGFTFFSTGPVSRSGRIPRSGLGNGDVLVIFLIYIYIVRVCLVCFFVGNDTLLQYLTKTPPLPFSISTKWVRIPTTANLLTDHFILTLRDSAMQARPVKKIDYLIELIDIHLIKPELI